MVTWKVPRAGRGAKRFRVVPTTEKVVLANVSVVGSGTHRPDDDGLQVGSRVPIAFEGEKGNVLVRWLRPADGRDGRPTTVASWSAPVGGSSRLSSRAPRTAERVEFEEYWSRVH